MSKLTREYYLTVVTVDNEPTLLINFVDSGVQSIPLDQHVAQQFKDVLAATGVLLQEALVEESRIPFDIA